MNLIIIQARLKSTRLPEKVLLEIKNKPIISHIVERCKQSNADKIVLAVPLEEINIFNAYCDCEVFGGSEKDVLKRFYDCAKRYKADNIIRITGDCSVIDFNIINEVLKYHELYKNEFTTNAFLGKENTPDGQEVSICSINLLKRIYKKAKGYHREHVFSDIMENFTDYGILIGYWMNVENEKYKFLRLSIDYPEDYKLIQILYKKLYKKNKYFGMEEIIELYKIKPEIFDINKMYRRDESYYKQLKDKNV